MAMENSGVFLVPHSPSHGAERTRLATEAATTYGATDAYDVYTDSPILSQTGRLNIRSIGIRNAHLRALTWYYTVVDLSWEALGGGLFFMYLCLVALFAAFYLMACWLHGAAATFVTAVYFSVETFSGQGGYMAEDPLMTDPMADAFELRIFATLTESYVSLMFCAGIAAVLISKASRGTILRHRIVFSEQAVITQAPQYNVYSSSDVLSLAFRLGNLHRRPLVGLCLRVYVIHRSQKKGNFVSLSSEQIPFSTLEESHIEYNSLLLWYPVTVVHSITPSSPLYKYTSTRALLDEHPQIVVVLSGSDASSGNPVEARHCYTAHDIVMHSHFSTNILQLAGGHLVANFAAFNEIVADEEVKDEFSTTDAENSEREL